MKQFKGYERDIKIQITNYQNEVKVFLSKTPNVSEKNHDIQAKNGLIYINKEDELFQLEGSYYLVVYPISNFWKKFTNDYYNYMIVYTSQDSHIYLYQGQL